MKVFDTTLADVKIIKPSIFADDRGYFSESFRDDWFRENIADVTFVQDNHSKSTYGILRGLHYQIKHPQGKLVRVLQGEIYDVVVDMRKSSASFGQNYACLLSADNQLQLWIPSGFAHGFYVTSQSADIVYKCTDYYAPQFEKILNWRDPYLRINWPIEKDKSPILSVKDQTGLAFSQSEYYA